MLWQSTPLLLPLLLAAVCSTALALYAWRQRALPGAQALALEMLAVTEWSLGYALELTAPNLPAQILWAKIEYLGIVIVPLAWLLLVIQYTGRGRWLTKTNQAVAALIPLITLALVFTNEAHGLVWSQIRQASVGPLHVLEIAYGPWFWVHTAFSYAALGLGTVLMALAFVRSPQVYRQQIGAWLLAVAAPWLGNAVYIARLGPLPQLDPTPFAFALSGLSVAWAIFRFHFLQTMPVARDAIIESMTDAVFVLDSQDRIVDFNPAARRCFSLPASGVIGQEVSAVLNLSHEGDVPYLEQTRAEVGFGLGAGRRDYELRISPVADRGGRRLGRLMVLADITSRKRAERRLSMEHDATQALAVADTLAQAAPAILQSICQGLEWEAGELWRVHEQAQQLRLVAMWSAPGVEADAFQAHTRGLTFASGADLPGRVWATGRPVWLGDLAADADFSRRGVAARLGWRGAFGFPIRVGNYVFGVMAFYSPEIREPVELSQMFEAVGSQIGQFLIRRRAEAALRESEARYKSFHEQLPVGVYRTTADGHILHANPALAAILGYDTVDELMCSALAPDLYVDPAERSRNLMQWQAGDVLIQESRLRTRDGRQIWVRDTGRAILDQAGEIDYIDGAIEDITEQKQAQEALACRVRELSALYETSLELNGQRELAALLQTIVKRSAELLGAQMSALHLVADDGQCLRLAASHNLPASDLGRRIRLGEGLSGRVAQSGQPMVVENYREWEGRTALYASLPIGRVLAVPLTVMDKVVGVVNVADEARTGAFSQDEMQLFRLFADQAAIAVGHARLYEAVQRELAERERTEVVLRVSEQQYRSLYLVSQRQALEQNLLNKVRLALARELDLPSLFRKVVGAMADTYGYTLVSIYLLQGDHLVLQHQSGYDSAPRSIPVTRGVVGRVVRTGAAALLKNVSADPDFVETQAGTTSEICVPLRDEGEVVGVLNVENADGKQFGEADLNLMTALSEHVGIAIARARLYTEARENERKFRAIVAAIPDTLVRIRRSGEIVGLGLSREQETAPYVPADAMIGSTPGALAPPAIADFILDNLRAAFDTGQMQVFESELPTAAGLQTFEVRLVAYDDDEALAIARDISERKRLEQMKSDFINRAAHELRTPLTTALMMVDLLQEGGGEDEAKQYLGVLAEELQRQRTLVEELLTLGRLESGTFQISARPLDLTPVIQDSVRALASQAEAKQIALRHTLRPDLPIVMGNESGLQQVVINLLNNAVKFTPEGGQVALSADRHDHGVRLRVSDTGMGIPPEDLPHLFSRFFRASNAIQNEVPGTGVGLYVVKSVVEKLGGRVAVESRVGQGATFEVWLPPAESGNGVHEAAR